MGLLGVLKINKLNWWNIAVTIFGTIQPWPSLSHIYRPHIYMMTHTYIPIRSFAELPPFFLFTFFTLFFLLFYLFPYLISHYLSTLYVLYGCNVRRYHGVHARAIVLTTSGCNVLRQQGVSAKAIVLTTIYTTASTLLSFLNPPIPLPVRFYCT